MSEQEQVIVGKLINPEQIETTKGKTLIDFNDFQHRAKWSFLRLQYGRQIDGIIKGRFEDEKVKTKFQAMVVLDKIWREKLAIIEPRLRRELQFIMRGDDTVMAVASLNHLLIPSAQVYATANQILVSMGSQQLLQEEDMAGQVLYEKEVAGIKYGMQIYGGSINTRFAIRVCNVFRVMKCLNVVSWLGIGGFKPWLGGQTRYDRVLRIKVITELQPRLEQALKDGKANVSKLEGEIKAAKKVHIMERQARAFASSMGFSYGLGAGTIKQVLEQFAREKQTLYGLSMAESWVARHGERSQQAKSVNQSLSTIAAANLLIKDVKDGEKRSIAWLKAHVKSGQLKNVDDIIGDLI